MTLVQKYSSKRFHIDKNYNYLFMVATSSACANKKNQSVTNVNNRKQLPLRNEQIIETRVVVERMIIGWRTVSC